MPIAVLYLVPMVLNLIGQFFPAGSAVTTISSEVASVLPSLVTAAQAEFALFQSGAPPTAAEQAAIDAALDQAEALLQAAQPGTASA